MIEYSKTPYYVKLCYKLIVIFLIGFFIKYTQAILVPFAFSVLLSLLLLPAVNQMEKKGLSPVWSIALSLLLSVLFLGILIFFLSTQIASFMDDVPSIRQHMEDHFIMLQHWIKNRLHISLTVQNDYLNTATEKLKASGTGYIKDTFFSVTEALMLLILLPIYTFLILYYRALIRRFLFDVFKKANSEKVAAVLTETKLMVKNYMVGLVIEMGIVAAANSIGLVILGIPYAIFFGVLAAVLNVIPYIGMFTATLFTVLVTMSTSSSTGHLVWIVVIMYGIHMIDVNILMPRIVGSKVRINALISLLGVVLGGLLTGLSGLFLSVPAVALTKIICDQVDDLKPWGMLLGDDITDNRKGRIYRTLSNIKLRRK
jgi:predicted PurR-regulated permease PerM